MELEKIVQIVKMLEKPKAKRKEITDGKIRIVVLQRGWIYVGRFFQSGSACWLENAACIRVWGTTKGLNELVSGPVSGKTVLDKTSKPVRFHELTVVFALDVEESSWEKYLV